MARGAVFTATQMKNVNLDGSVLQIVDFQKSKLREVSFKDANLQNARFDFASLTATNFTNANLGSAIFNNSLLKTVNFTGAALKYASFLGATTDDLNLTGTDWWLAKGWNSSQIETFLDRFPRSQFIASPVFEARKSKDRADIDVAKQNRNALQESRFLNTFAWDLAIAGEDYQIAQSNAERAVAICKEISCPQENEGNYKDTLAYVLMLEDNWDRAYDIEKDVMKQERSPYLAEWGYHYALILLHQGNKDSAVEYLQQSLKGGYFPSHEFVLLRTLTQQLTATSPGRE